MRHGAAVDFSEMKAPGVATVLRHLLLRPAGAATSARGDPGSGRMVGISGYEPLCEYAIMPRYREHSGRMNVYLARSQSKIPAGVVSIHAKTHVGVRRRSRAV